MPTAQQIRAQVEKRLAHRIPLALTPAPRILRPTLPSGVESLDALLHGGFPLGAISEVVGAPGSGLTTLAMTLLARVSQSGHACAWIDASDAFDPLSASQNGMHLPSLLWVRCRADKEFAPTTVTKSKGIGSNTPVSLSPHTGGHGSTHPRQEVHGMDRAVSDLLKHKFAGRRSKLGTPGAQNIPLGTVKRNEQVASDRLPSRRSSTYQPPEAHQPPGIQKSSPHATRKSQSPFAWKRLEQSIKVANLLLQGGGFQAIVLDYASIAPEQVSRIPLATWFRFRAAAEAHHTCLLLLAQHTCAQSSAEVSLLLDQPTIQDEHTVLTGMGYNFHLARRRFAPSSDRVIPIRKPPQSTQTTGWSVPTPWAKS